MQTLAGTSQTCIPWPSGREPIRSVAFSPDGALLVGAASDGSIMLWSSVRSEVSGTELDDILAAAEDLVELTRGLLR